MQRSPAAAEAASVAPMCLSAFEYHLQPLQSGGLALAVDYALKCRKCAGDVFQILGHPLAPDPFEPMEQAFYGPPHRLKCVSCAGEASLFDAATQGYDGVLNRGCACEHEDNTETAMLGEFNVVVSFCYNIELEELRELALKAKVNPSDLFDAIVIVGSPVDDADEVELAYECA